MKFLFSFLLFFLISCTADAQVPNFISPETLNDVMIVTDPIPAQAFYGVLENFPHTYEIHSTVPFHLFTQILVPDIETSRNNISGIIIKLPETEGRVTEVVTLDAKNSEWHSEFEAMSGDSYRKGPAFEKDLEAGTYRIEVHTPDNIEKYVLLIGSEEEKSIGYFARIKRLIAIKAFFEKSPISIIESPLVYIPLFVILFVGGGIWYIRRRQRR